MKYLLFDKEPEIYAFWDFYIQLLFLLYFHSDIQPLCSQYQCIGGGLMTYPRKQLEYCRTNTGCS